MMRRLRKEFGGLDILVNNAANYETVEFAKLTVAQWDAIFASNTRGPFLVSREVVELCSRRRGKIINMGSLGGLRRLGGPCALLLIQSGSAYADQSDGESSGPGDRRKLCGSRHD